MRRPIVDAIRALAVASAVSVVVTWMVYGDLYLGFFTSLIGLYVAPSIALYYLFDFAAPPKTRRFRDLIYFSSLSPFGVLLTLGVFHVIASEGGWAEPLLLAYIVQAVTAYGMMVFFRKWQPSANRCPSTANAFAVRTKERQFSLKRLFAITTALAVQFGLFSASKALDSELLVLGSYSSLGVLAGGSFGMLLKGRNGAVVGAAIGLVVMSFVFAILAIVD